MKCPCDKKCFRNMRTAHKAVERILLEGGPQMRPYRCEYGAIHLTSQPKDFYWNVMPQMQTQSFQQENYCLFNGASR